MTAYRTLLIDNIMEYYMKILVILLYVNVRCMSMHGTNDIERLEDGIKKGDRKEGRPHGVRGGAMDAAPHNHGGRSGLSGQRTACAP